MSSSPQTTILGAAILAGVTRNVSQRSADDLVRETAQFTDLVADATVLPLTYSNC